MASCASGPHAILLPVPRLLAAVQTLMQERNGLFQRARIAINGQSRVFTARQLEIIKIVAEQPTNRVHPCTRRNEVSLKPQTQYAFLSKAIDTRFDGVSVLIRHTQRRPVDEEWNARLGDHGGRPKSSATSVKANPPVRHIPTTPTPESLPSDFNLRHRARNQETIGLVLFAAKAWISLLTQMRSAFACLPNNPGLALPKSSGRCTRAGTLSDK